MTRPAYALVFAFLPFSASVLAQPTGPLEDPRICLIDEANTIDRSNLTAGVKEWLDKTPWTGGPSTDQISAAMAGRCMVTRNWHPAYRKGAQTLAWAEGYVRVLSERLTQQGLSIADLDHFITELPYDQLGNYKWLHQRDASFAKYLQAAIARMNRKPTTEAQKAMVVTYLKYRADAEKQFRNFGRLNGQQADQFLYETWQILPALEASRPVIRERVLTTEEQAEVTRLRKLYFAPAKDGGNRLEQLQRLVELGQSGNREAMIAARDALGKGPPLAMINEYLDLNLDTALPRELTSRLAAIWTAMIWARFGYEDAGRKYMAPCVGGLFGEVYKDKKLGVAAYLHSDGTVRQVNNNGQEIDSTADGCGFTLLGKPVSAGVPKSAQVLQYYNKASSFGAAGDRRPNGDFYITGAQFNPVMGDRDFVEKKFAAHLALRRSGIVYNLQTGQYNFATPTLAITRPWYERYALETGRLGLLQEADAATVKAIADQRAAIIRGWENDWTKAKEAYLLEPYNQDKLDTFQKMSSNLGGAKWQEFRKLVPNWQPQAEVGPAQASNAGGGYGGGGNSNSVEVRSYDSNGTYTGSSRVSAVWADIMKMTSGPPR